MREFAQEELRPHADTFDREKSFPTEQVMTMLSVQLGVQVQDPCLKVSCWWNISAPTTAGKNDGGDGSDGD